MSDRPELPDSESLIEIVKQRTDTILLSFSMGKDSLAMWLYLRPHFRIIPYYMYMVPGLRSDEGPLAYYENWFDTHIIRMPHPLLYSQLRDLVYQPPDRVARILDMELPAFEYSDIDNLLFQEFGLTDSFCAIGMRMKDNIDRRNMILQRGVLGEGKRRYYYGVWDWDVNQVGAQIARAGVRIHPLYDVIGRTIIAFDYQYMKPFREAYPDDFERVLEWFPLMGAEFFRYERMGHYAARED